MSDDQNQRARNLALAGVAGLAGVCTVIVVVAALLLGLWLDTQADQRGPFTIGLVILSIPVSLVMMLVIVLRVTRAIQPPVAKTTHESAERTGFGEPPEED